MKNEYPPAWNKKFLPFKAHLDYWREIAEDSNTEKLLSLNKMYIDTYLHMFCQKLSSHHDKYYQIIKKIVYAHLSQVSDMNRLTFILSVLTKVLNEEVECKWNKKYGDARGVAIRLTLFLYYIHIDIRFTSEVSRLCDNFFLEISRVSEFRAISFTRCRYLVNQLYFSIHSFEERSEVVKRLTTLCLEFEKIFRS